MLEDLGDEHLEALLEIMSSVRNEHLRDALFAYVERVLPGNEARVVDRLMAASADVARPIMGMLAALRSKAAKDALQRLAQCPSPMLRCEGTALLAKSPDKLRDSLIALAENADADVRLAALRTLAFHHVRGAGPLLVRKVQDPNFHHLSIDERGELLRALYALHAQRAEVVAIEIVQKHGIIPDEELDQTRALVAELLGREAKSMEALTAVLAATKRRWWNGPPVREAAMAAAEAIAARLGKRVTAAGEIQ